MLRIFNIFIISIVLISFGNFLILYLHFQVSTNEKEFKFDSELGWSFSNYKKLNFNELGLRNIESEEFIEKSSKPKVVFLGNSVVAGAGLEIGEVFTSQMNRMPISNAYLFLNGGAEGYEFYREKIKFKRDFIKLKPTQVIWFPSINDFQKLSNVQKTLDDTQQVQGKKLEKFPRILISGFEFVAGVIQEKKENLIVKYLWSLKNNYYTNGLKSNLEADVKKDLMGELTEFIHLLEKDNIKFKVVYLPSHYFCKYNSWDEANSFLELHSYLDSLNIKQYNLFNRLNCKNEIVFNDFVHLNSLGHKKLASILVEEVINK